MEKLTRVEVMKRATFIRKDNDYYNDKRGLAVDGSTNSHHT